MPVTQTIVSKREALRCKFPGRKQTNKQTVSAQIHLAVEWKNWLLQTRRSLHNSRRRWAGVISSLCISNDWIGTSGPQPIIYFAPLLRDWNYTHTYGETSDSQGITERWYNPACVQWSTFLWNKSWRCADRFVSWALALASPAAADSIHWSSELLTQWLDSNRPRQEKILILWIIAAEL